MLVMQMCARTKIRAELGQHEAQNGDNRHINIHMNYAFTYGAPRVLREDESGALGAARHRAGWMGA